MSGVYVGFPLEKLSTGWLTLIHLHDQRSSDLLEGKKSVLPIDPQIFECWSYVYIANLEAGKETSKFSEILCYFSDKVFGAKMMFEEKLVVSSNVNL